MAAGEQRDFPEPERYSVPFGVFLALEAFGASARNGEVDQASWHHLTDAYRMLYGPEADPSALPVDELIASIQLAIAAGLPDEMAQRPEGEAEGPPPPKGPASVAEAAGVDVEGWRKRSRGDFDPRGIVIHTTVPQPDAIAEVVRAADLSPAARAFITRRAIQVGTVVIVACAQSAGTAALAGAAYIIWDLYGLYTDRRARRSPSTPAQEAP